MSIHGGSRFLRTHMQSIYRHDILSRDIVSTGANFKLPRTGDEYDCALYVPHHFAVPDHRQSRSDRYSWLGPWFSDTGTDWKREGLACNASVVSPKRLELFFP